MLSFEAANELVNLLQDRFDGMMRSDADRDRWRTFVSNLDDNPSIVTRAIERLVADWTQRRNPTKPEITKAVEKARIEWRSSARVRETYEEARALRDAYGDPFLAMFAKPAERGCFDCANDYIPRGISIDNPYLRHEHVTAQEMDQNPALELAIADAKRMTRHPLESAARPMTSDEKVKMVRALRETLFGKQETTLDSRE